MARRVLGDDPFAPPAEPAAEEPPKPRTRRSVPPPAKAEGAAEGAPAPKKSVPPPKKPAPRKSTPPPAKAVAEGAKAAEVPLADAVRSLEAVIAKVLASDDADARAALLTLVSRVHGSERPTESAPAVPEEPPAPAEVPAEAPAADAEVDVARELLSSEFYLRKWGRVALRERVEDVDDFGYDARYEARWRPLWDFLYDRWWRIDVEGIHHVPAEGPVALVANHSGAIPWDGVMLATALRKEHPSARQLRWLAEDFLFHFPFLGVYSNRIGAVRACPENAERLLRQGQCVAMFPEGVKGLSKLYAERYKLQRFGRGGHIRLALRTKTPVIPVTVVGAEEASPNVLPSGFLSRLLGVPYVPLTPTFPWLGPLGLIPAPSKWRIVFGEPLEFDRNADPDDELTITRINERLRLTIQATLDRSVAQRRSVWRG